MATLMEKDVLLELTSGAYAMITKSDKKEQKDIDSLLELKDTLYGTHEADIDYRKTADYIKSIKAKYEWWNKGYTR